MPRFDKPDRSAAIGARICIARVTAGLSRREVGAAFGLSHAQIEKYELGVSRLPATMLVDLGRLLVRPSTFFIEGDEAALARAMLLELPRKGVSRRQLDRAVATLKLVATEGATAAGRPGSAEERSTA